MYPSARIYRQKQDFSQSTHRVASATFWRTFHHDGKISPAWGGWAWVRVDTAYPLSLHLLSRTKLWCTLQLKGQVLVHSPYFYSTPICTLWELYT